MVQEEHALCDRVGASDPAHSGRTAKNHFFFPFFFFSFFFFFSLCESRAALESRPLEASRGGGKKALKTFGGAFFCHSSLFAEEGGPGRVA